MTEMTAARTCLVVGGGIAGLAAAIALVQKGVEVELVEIADSFGVVGSGISIGGRAPQALQELGIYDEVASKGEVGQDVPRMYDRAGEPIPMPPRGTRKVDGVLEPVGAYRPVLAEALRARAETVGVQLRISTSIRSITDDDEHVTVTFTDDATKAYDLVIGADGAYSTVRGLVFPDAPRPEYTGQMSIRWMFRHNGPIDGSGFYLAGEMGRIGMSYLPWPKVVYCPLVVNMPRTRLDAQQAFDLVAQMTANFSGGAIVEARKHLSIDDEIIARPFDWILLDQWHRGHVVLIGDAAHATSAHMGMGGGMALEDGVVLADEIARHADVEAALTAFRERRWPRVSAVVNTSVALSRAEQTGETGPGTAKLQGETMSLLHQPY